MAFENRSEEKTIRRIIIGVFPRPEHLRRNRPPMDRIREFQHRRLSTDRYVARPMSGNNIRAGYVRRIIAFVPVRTDLPQTRQEFSQRPAKRGLTFAGD